ncbi:MAG: CBS domain-containing protein [Desulfovibrionaceae bacterium]
MRTARDIMTSKVITLNQDADVAEAARVLLEKKINGVPVVDDAGALVGVICQADLVAQQKKISLPSFFTLLDGVFPVTATAELDREMEKIAALTVGQAMTPKPKTVTPETPLDELASLMADRKLYTLPVLEDGKLVGVVGKEDILKAAFSE